MSTTPRADAASQDSPPDYTVLRYAPDDLAFRLRNYAQDRCEDDAWLANLLTQSAEYLTQLAAKEQELAEARKYATNIELLLDESRAKLNDARQQLTARDATIEGLREALKDLSETSWTDTQDGEGGDDLKCYRAYVKRKALAVLAQLPPLPSAVPIAPVCCGKPMQETDDSYYCPVCKACGKPANPSTDHGAPVHPDRVADLLLDAMTMLISCQTNMRYPDAKQVNELSGRVSDILFNYGTTGTHLPVHPDTARLMNQLEKDLRGLKDHANECAAGSPPDGYEELEPGSKPLAIADACYHHGLDAMETAVANWIFDQRTAARKSEHPDTARLDWLESHPGCGANLLEHEPADKRGHVYFNKHWVEKAGEPGSHAVWDHEHAPTVRAAIDGAMRADAARQSTGEQGI